MPPGAAPGWNSRPSRCSSIAGLRHVDAAGLAGQHAVEAQRRHQLAALDLAGDDLVEIHAVDAENKPLLRRTPADFADAQRGILHMRGDHREIVVVECDETPRIHEDLTPVMRSMVAPQAEELVLEALEAAIQMIDAVDDGLAFGRERRR